MATESQTESTIKQHEFVPPELWGRDHYSTLAYIETKIVDAGLYSVSFDPRMRQTRRHYRVLGEALPSHRKREARFGEPMRDEYGTRLNNATFIPWHDDWHCVQDAMYYGVFEDAGFEGDVQPGMDLKLTDLGHKLTAAIREHKAAGGNFPDFKLSDELLAELQAAGKKEAPENCTNCGRPSDTNVCRDPIAHYMSQTNKQAAA